MSNQIGEKKADGVAVRFAGNNTILIVSQENDMKPSKLDTIILVNKESIDSLIRKLEVAKEGIR